MDKSTSIETPKKIDYDLKKYPHADTGVLIPTSRFYIKGRWLCLYWNKNRKTNAAYTLCWADENNSLKHAMTDTEVFIVLASLINPE